MSGRPNRLSWQPDLADLAARVLVGGLFLALAVRVGQNFLQTGHVTGLLLLVSEGLVVVLMIARRRASDVDRTLAARLVTAASIVGPFLVVPVLAGPRLPEAITAAVSAAGLAIVVTGKLSLGRSFGLVPANRGIVSTGLYRLVRHPIYVGYLLTHAAFLAAYPTAWNVLAIVGADAALVLRTLYEERTLVRDPAYATYRMQVRWRLVPGVF